MYDTEGSKFDNQTNTNKKNISWVWDINEALTEMANEAKKVWMKHVKYKDLYTKR